MSVTPTAGPNPTNPDITDHTDTSDYLGDNFHNIVGTVEVWLGIQAVLCNTLVIYRYRAAISRTIPLMYLMIASCDVVTGAAAFLTGILILSVKHHLDVALDLSHVAYPLYSIAIPTSIFLNVNLAAIRTVNLWRPLHQIKRRVVVVVVLVCLLYWTVFTAWHMSKWERAASLLSSYIYYPSQFQAVFHAGTTSQQECLNVIAFVTVPYLLPSLVVLGCMAVQVFWMWRETAQDGDRWRQRRHVTVTILSLTLLFFVCNSVYIYLPVSHCRSTSWQRAKGTGMWSHVTGLVFPFFNAAFSPVILLLRAGRMCGRESGDNKLEKGNETVLSNNCTEGNIDTSPC
ncbi:hypothetical protein ACHWQZ_G006685 [Mnemiopsis leidyi]